jgi:N-acetylglucosaminyldiphosphoundecaprenol N-acetyl-beta-D-mannosaminyltransferase
MTAQATTRRQVSAHHILGQRVDATTYDDAARQVLQWARGGESRYICVSPVHMVMESHDDPEFRAVVNGADMVTPDGVPIVWALRLLGVADATRVYGPSFTEKLCAQAAAEGVPVGFYGGAPAVLDVLVRTLKTRYPSLEVAYHHSPPFRSLSTDEEEAVVQEINDSGARILFVGLGCPKQERWMARHRGHINCVMLGVGAAFDFIAGTKRQAPRFIQNMGMEWGFRLLSEPRRLGWRYLYHNPRYVAFFTRQLLSRS